MEYLGSWAFIWFLLNVLKANISLWKT